ncbi:MAG: signal peptidase [Rhodobacterales bacterium]|nr:MAG: signal peptidase [Rhodobacterales bacterium]
MRKALLFCLGLLAAPAVADIDTVIDDHILKNTAAFAQSAADLARTANKDCTPDGMKAAYHQAFDAWVRASHIRFGPIESNGEGLAIAYWPDKKGLIPKHLKRVINAKDPVVYDAKLFAGYSVATRGFFALEQLLFDDKFSDYTTDDYRCDLVKAISKDLARVSLQTHAGWVNGFAETLRNAGADGNEVFLTDKEGAQALFTNLLAGMEYIYAQRIARPLGKFERPKPRRAEAWRSNRSMRNIVVSLEALQEMTLMLADGQAWETVELFDSLLTYAKSLDDDIFQHLDENGANFKVQSLREMVANVHEAINAEVGAHLGVVAGFNALDGD